MPVIRNILLILDMEKGIGLRSLQSEKTCCYKAQARPVEC